MNRRHRFLMAAGMLAPACAPSAPAAHRGQAPQTAVSTPAVDAAAAGPGEAEVVATSAPGPAPTDAPATTVTILAPPAAPATARRAPSTTVAVPAFVLPEKADEGRTDAQWWASQPGACGGSLPPCSVMRRESGGDPRVWNGGCYDGPCAGGSMASGKWQFLRSTWAGYGGYRDAANAPERVQDDKARALWAGGAGCSHWAAC